MRHRRLFALLCTFGSVVGCNSQPPTVPAQPATPPATVLNDTPPSAPPATGTAAMPSAPVAAAPVPVTPPAAGSPGALPSEQQAAAELEKLRYEVVQFEGHVEKISAPFTGVQTTDDHLRFAGACPQLKELMVVDGAKLSDVGLSYLSGLEKLHSLMILEEVPAITDAGLKHLAGNSVLGLLSISSPQMTDDGVENLNLAGKPNLWSVSFDGSRVTDKGLALISELPRLRVLGLQGCPISDAGLAKLAGSRVESLYITDTPITAAGMEHVATLDALEVLKLGGDSVTDASLEMLPPNLRYVELERTKVTDAGLQQLKSLPGLKQMSLKNNTALTQAGLDQLKQALPELDAKLE